MGSRKSIVIARLRKDYLNASFDQQTAARSPISQFSKWFDEAIEAQLIEPNAMLLATTTRSGQPSVRAVLLKHWSLRGFIFFTNYSSRKASEISANSKVALLFYWPELERQIRIEGTVFKVSRKVSEQYFSKRPRSAQLGAWASKQSSEIQSRQYLELDYQSQTKLFAEQIVPCPPDWGGYCVRPRYFEFWQGRASRLHDRIAYRQRANKWRRFRLAP